MSIISLDGSKNERVKTKFFVNNIHETIVEVCFNFANSVVYFGDEEKEVIVVDYVVNVFEHGNNPVTCNNHSEVVLKFSENQPLLFSNYYNAAKSILCDSIHRIDTHENAISLAILIMLAYEKNREVCLLKIRNGLNVVIPTK